METKKEGQGRRQREYVKRNKDAVRSRERVQDKERRRKDPRKTMVDNARRRAKLKGLAFDITFEDIVIPNVCPVLGIPLYVTTGHPKANSPSLDKYIPSKGYIKGNIHIISQRANLMKNDATTEEVIKLMEWMMHIDTTQEK